jgi:hypothetical protein
MKYVCSPEPVCENVKFMLPLNFAFHNIPTVCQPLLAVKEILQWYLMIIVS